MATRSPRVIWKGAISFGLVHVPVALYAAAQRHSLDFDLLDKRSMDPIGYRKVNKSTGREVPSAAIVKGYEYQKGHYVVLEDEDLKRANPVATQTVEILRFVEEGAIPPTYFDTPYYLAPGPRGDKVYALLREAMKKAGCIAIASVVIQTRQHPAALIPQERLLLLNTLRFADELREPKGLDLPSGGLKAAGVSGKEVEMALSLIENMRGEWDPELLRDTYQADVIKRLEAKVKAGKTEEVEEPDESEEPRKSAEVVDLMALLKKSVKHGGRKPARHAKRRASTARQRHAARRRA
jgi:DNA end-binding protein Ku